MLRSRLLLRPAWLLTAVLVLWLPAPARAAPEPSACPAPAPVVLAQDPQRIDAGVELLYDPQRHYRRDQVTGGALCARYRRVEGTPNFGNDRRGVWLRFRVPPPPAGSAPRRLLIRFAQLDRVCVHWPVAGGYREDCGGVSDPLDERPRAHAGFFFDEPAALDSARPVLVYAQADIWLRLPLELGTGAGFTRVEHLRQTWLGAFYGVLLGAVLFGYAMYLSHRDRTYLYFSSFLFTLTLWNALWENHLSAWGLSGWGAMRMVPPLVGLSLALGSRFYQRYLESRTHTPRAYRLLSACSWSGLVLGATQPLLPTLGTLLLSLLCIAWLLVVLAAAGARLRQGFPPALAALLGSAVLLAGFFTGAMEAAGLPLMDVEYSNLIMFTGIFLTAGFLLFGLAYRVRRLAQERDQANELALSSQKLALHRAHYDPLTRLPNRARFHEELQARLAPASGAQRLAVVSIGLDHFTAFSHALGYKVGDSVLEEIARRLRRQVGEDSLLARTGPDLFAWLSPVAAGDSGAAALRQRCQELHAVLAAPLELGSGATLTASLGIALYPDHANTAEQLLQYSDAALHDAKTRGSASLRWYEPSLQQRASRYLELNRELHRALEQGALELHYQPIVSLGDGRLLGVESLARWRREDGRYVPPEQFVSVAESSDLLPAFTAWGLRTACRQLADWRARGLSIPYLAFNLSALQLRLERIDELVLEQLRESGGPAEGLTLEVTEGTLLENLEATRAMLNRLRSQGLRVAVDDFGVGYASPHYLRVLPVDILKLDGVFLRGVPQDAEANSVLEGLITLGQSLKLRIVTEGVETEAQARYLASRRVTAGQGYWFSRALPAADLERWMQQRWPRAAA